MVTIEFTRDEGYLTWAILHVWHEKPPLNMEPERIAMLGVIERKFELAYERGELDG